MNAKHTLFVCQTCAFSKEARERNEQAGGQILLEEITKLSQNWELRETISIQAVECMSACNRCCVVSLAAPGKYTYLFGDLPVTESAEAVLQCASQYWLSKDGYLPWSERPQPLKNGILARIPPLPQ